MEVHVLLQHTATDAVLVSVYEDKAEAEREKEKREKAIEKEPFGGILRYSLTGVELVAKRNRRG